MSAFHGADQPVPITFFPDFAAAIRREESISMAALADRIVNTSAASKGELPWLKLATFGDLRSDKNSLRHNPNVLAITGIEADYDKERVSFDNAAAILTEAGVASLVYTSPSHTEDAPRWRVLCPLSKPMRPAQRDLCMARLNGLFGSIFARESWTLSQSYYYGSVNHNPSHRVELIEGTPIDLMDDLDAGAIGKPETKAINGHANERPVGCAGGSYCIPISDTRLERFRRSVLDTLRRKAVDGQKHTQLRNAALILGGIQWAAGFTDAEAVQWMMDALPPSVLDWKLAQETALWGLAQGRQRPIELPDRPRPINGGRALPEPPPATDEADYGTSREDNPQEEAKPTGNPDGTGAASEPSSKSNGPTDPGAAQPEAKDAEVKDLITEGSVADAFVHEHRRQLRYCHHTGAWFLWDGARWKREETKLAYRWAHQQARALAADTKNARAIVTAGKAAFAAGVERLAQSDRAFAVTSEIWDADPWLLGTPGGTVNLKTGELRPARQDDFITKLTAIGPAETPDCPMWLAFLHQACGADAGYVRFLRQWCGYSLTGSVQEHAFLFLHGPGGNGKGVWLNTVSHIIGDYCTVAAMDTFIASKGDRHPTDLAALKGARMVCAAETEEGRQWSEVRIKQLTGGDKIAARFMRQDFFEFIPQFKLTIIGNHMPELRNVDDAAKRRINMGPFRHKPPIPDKRLEEKLRAEWPGILRWMIEGCLDWQANGLVRPAVVTASTAEYFDDQDLLTQWIEECCVKTGKDGRPLADTLANLLASWRSFAKGRGEEFSGSRGFSSALQKRGFTRIKDTHGIRGRGILGLKARVHFKPPPPGSAEPPPPPDSAG